MIDLHCHILPGLDDGAHDIEDSVAMARQALEDGIAVVCATPHLRDDHDVRVEEIGERVAALQQVLDARAVDVRVVAGAELAQTRAEQLSRAQLRQAALGAHGGWILLEPAPGPLDEGLEAVAHHLAGQGLRTVIAHPERHAGADFRERLHALALAGCLIQWTAEFLSRAQAGDIVMELAREGLVHLLGSDAHSSHAGRPVRLAAGFRSLARVRSTAELNWSMNEAPEAILAGQPLGAPPA